MAKEPLYYSVGDTVFKNPVTTKNDDGTSSTSVGFEVCVVNEIIGEDGAEFIAQALTEYEAKE